MAARRIQTRFLRALLLGLLGACAPAPRALDAPRAGQNAQYREVTLGLCEDYPEESRSLEGVRRDLELIASTGVGALRVSIGWDGVEPRRDHYDFAFWDAFVDLAVREYGLTLIPYVAYTPEWNSSAGPSDFWKAPPSDSAEFGELVGLLARRYHGKIHSWELWNEPDNRDYWTGSPEQYLALLEVGAAAVREVDPELRVVFGGLAGGLGFLGEVFELGGSRHVDVVNLHAYYETWNPEPLETIPEYVAGAAAIVQRHGGNQALWMAEVGYSNYRRGSYVSAATSAHFDYEHTLDYQAVVLIETLALAYSSPEISLVAWYELKDPPPTDEMIGDVNNRHLGIAFADYRPKPALAALSFMNRLFRDGFADVAGRLQVESLPARDAAAASGEDDGTGPLSGSPPELRAFLSARGTLIIIAWLPTGRPQTPAHGEPESASVIRLQLAQHTTGEVGRASAEGARLLGRFRGGSRASSPARREAPTPRMIDLHAGSFGGDSSDRRHLRLRVTAPFEARGPATFYDHTGRALRDAVISRTGGGENSVIDIEVRGGQVQIVELPVVVR